MDDHLVGLPTGFRKYWLLNTYTAAWHLVDGAFWNKQLTRLAVLAHCFKASGSKDMDCSSRASGDRQLPRVGTGVPCCFFSTGPYAWSTSFMNFQLVIFPRLRMMQLFSGKRSFHWPSCKSKTWSFIFPVIAISDGIWLWLTRPKKAYADLSHVALTRFLRQDA